jgi:hypothetical protein
VKDVGEPCEGEPHARFEGGREATRCRWPSRPKGPVSLPPTRQRGRETADYCFWRDAEVAISARGVRPRFLWSCRAEALAGVVLHERLSRPSRPLRTTGRGYGITKPNARSATFRSSVAPDTRRRAVPRVVEPSVHTRIPG